jgi:hypothetical protein
MVEEFEDNKQERYIWEIKNFHPLSKWQLAQEKYEFTKEAYWDLIMFFLKRPQTEHTKKCIEELQKGWKEFDEKYKNSLST